MWPRTISGVGEDGASPCLYILIHDLLEREEMFDRTFTRELGLDMSELVGIVDGIPYASTRHREEVAKPTAVIATA